MPYAPSAARPRCASRGNVWSLSQRAACGHSWSCANARTASRIISWSGVSSMGRRSYACPGGSEVRVPAQRPHLGRAAVAVVAGVGDVLEAGADRVAQRQGAATEIGQHETVIGLQDALGAIGQGTVAKE